MRYDDKDVLGLYLLTRDIRKCMGAGADLLDLREDEKCEDDEYSHDHEFDLELEEAFYYRAHEVATRLRNNSNYLHNFVGAPVLSEWLAEYDCACENMWKVDNYLDDLARFTTTDYIFHKLIDLIEDELSAYDNKEELLANYLARQERPAGEDNEDGERE